MPTLQVWYHDPIEVDPRSSWRGLTRTLAGASYADHRSCVDASITRLFQYARPDAVIAADGKPILVLEQTTMNPSGHNIPQRFSFIEKAAENLVPSICYYPKSAARTTSDPNLRNLNVRVPLAQFLLMDTWDALCLSSFWPIGGAKNLPARQLSAHRSLALTIDEIVDYYLRSSQLPLRSNTSTMPEVTMRIAEMDAVIATFGTKRSYPRNSSVSTVYPLGLPGTQRGAQTPIDPPPKAQLLRSESFVKLLEARHHTRNRHWSAERNNFNTRDFSLVFTGTANRQQTDSEHPHYGHLVMLDVLYCRNVGSRSRIDRRFNLVYRLPKVKLSDFLDSMHGGSTAAHITINHADLVILDDGVITGDSSARPQQIMLRT